MGWWTHSSLHTQDYIYVLLQGAHAFSLFACANGMLSYSILDSDLKLYCWNHNIVFCLLFHLHCALLLVTQLSMLPTRISSKIGTTMHASMTATTQEAWVTTLAISSIESSSFVACSAWSSVCIWLSLLFHTANQSIITVCFGCGSWAIASVVPFVPSVVLSDWVLATAVRKPHA